MVRISHNWTEYGEIQSISLYSVRIRENMDQQNSAYGHFSGIVNIEEFHGFNNTYTPNKLFLPRLSVVLSV